MERTRAALGNLVNYEAVTAISPLAPPLTDKGAIPKFIHCPQYQRAQSRIESAMERYTRKVQQAEERLQQSQQHLASLEEAIEEWNQRAKGVGIVNRITLDRSNPASVERYNRDVARHNDAVEQVRRFQDRRDDAIEKHNDLVERYNEAVEEAREKLEQLNIEALAEIDHDLVTFLDRCLQTAARLGESQHPPELLAALETCFLALKIHHAFEQHIDGNALRQQARQHAGEIGLLLGELCGHQSLRTALQDIFQRNLALIETNAGLCAQALAAVGTVNQDEMEATAESFQGAFDENFRVQYSYHGVVDPAQLETLVREMQQTIDAIDHNISRTRELFESSSTLAEGALAAQQTSQILLAAMRSNVADMGDYRLSRGHFVRELVDQAVMEELLSRELRAAVAGVRNYLAEAISEPKLNALLGENPDSSSIARAEGAIQQADLLRLPTSRGQVEGHIQQLSRMTQEIRDHIHRAGQVPAQNSARFRSLTLVLFPLSCLPVVGLVAALIILKKIESFRPAFTSAIPVYQELAVETLNRNKTFQTINLALGFNALAGLVLVQARKRLSSYLGVSPSGAEDRSLARTD